MCAACSGDDRPAPLVLQFTADPGPPGSEQYQCFGFALGALADADIGSIAFAAPPGPVTLHHLSLFAASTDYPPGPIECLAMPDEAVPMNVWVPGAADLTIADDMSLAIPDGTTHMIVQAHVLRSDDGAAGEATITITPRAPALRRAGWLPLRAAVPALRPHYREEAVATCTVASDLHIVSTWPHMHRAGAEFHGRVLHAATSELLVDVVPWEFDAQRTYPVTVTAASGDAIETHCVWQNDTDTTILPGPYITQEMCGQSLIAYPADAARCL